MTGHLTLIVICSDCKYNITVLTPLYLTKEEIPTEEEEALFKSSLTVFICPFQDYYYSFGVNGTFTYFMIDLLSIA